VYFQLHESKRQQNQSRFFCRKTNCHGFDYELSESSVTRTDCIRDLGVLIDTNLLFHIFCHAIGLLGSIQTVTLRFSSLHSLLTLYCTLVRPQLQYASVAWNLSLLRMSVGLERVHRSFCLFVIIVFSVT